MQACQENPGKQTTEQQASIHEKIQTDLEDGLSSPLTLNLQRADLPTTKYAADKAHSSISFRTKHWEIVHLIGWVEDFEVVMYADQVDFTDAVIAGKVDLTSIRMPNVKMQESLQQVPYFDTEHHRYAAFQSTSMIKTEDNRYQLDGTMTINGMNKPITFEVDFHGYAYPGEKSICGFSAKGVIRRDDYQIGGHDQLHSGRQIHDDQIEVLLDLRME